MAADRSSYTIDLRDGTTAPARQMSAALEQLRARVTAGTATLARMQASMKRLQSAASVDVATFRRLQSAIDHQKASVAALEAEYIGLGGTFDKVGKKAGRLDLLGDAAREAGGPIGSLVSGVSRLANPLSLAIAIAASGVAAYVALAAAVVGAVVAMGRLALASSDERRSELLHFEGLTTLRNVYGVVAGRASDLVAAIDRVSDASALSRGEVSGMAESLYRAGLRGANLSDALAGLSIAQSVQGDRGAARFRAMAISIARTGGSVRRLADDYRARLGGIAQRQALGLDRQMQRLHESIGRLFGDVRIEGFLSALHEVVSLFSQSTETGRALHTLVGALFNPLFDQIAGLGPLARRFFQGMLIEAQRLTIIFLRVRNAIQHAFGSETRAALFGGADALSLGRFAAYGLAAALLLVLVPLAILGAYAFVAFQRLSQMATAFNALRDGAREWTIAGRQMVDGLVGSITGGAERVRAAVSGLAATAVSSLRQALGIHSPSRVFAELGRQVPRGMELGIDRGSEGVGSASDRMAASSAGGGAAGVSRGSSRPSISIGDIHVTVNGQGDARAIAQGIRDELASLLESVAIEMGAT